MDDIGLPAACVGDARTTGRRSARSRRIEVITRGERRRVLDVEQKRDIVLASFQPGARPADVARHCGIIITALRVLLTSRRSALRNAVNGRTRLETQAARGYPPRVNERRRRVSGMEHLTGADTARVPLYLHGGGFSGGSIVSHRALVFGRPILEVFDRRSHRAYPAAPDRRKRRRGCTVTAGKILGQGELRLGLRRADRQGQGHGEAQHDFFAAGSAGCDFGCHSTGDHRDNGR